MQVNAKPAAAPGDGTPGSEEPALIKMNNQHSKLDLAMPINDMSLDLSRSISQEEEPPLLLDTAEGSEPADAIKIKIAVKKQARFALRLAPLIPRTVNPFRVPAIRYSPWYVFKTAAVAVTLFPVRCVVLLLFLGVSVLFGRLATLGVDRDHPRPSAVRRLLVQPIRLCARAALWSLGYWWVRVEYRAGSAPGRARVLAAAPHYSLLDAIVLAWLELPSSVAKAGVARMPLFGAVAVALQCIFVDRQDPESKHKCVDAIRERATNPAGAPLLLFPEGTCTNGEALITFKAGAFLPGAPVQPVVLRYPFSHLSVSAAGGDAEWRLLLCLFSVYNRLTVIYLPLYTPSAEEVADPALFARNVRAVMAAELGVGVTAHSYEDA